MTNKLSILTANQRLLAETDASRVKAVKLQLSTRKAGAVSLPKVKDKPDTTKITQITVDQKDTRKLPPAGAPGQKSGIPQSSMATPSDIKPMFAKGMKKGDDGAPSQPKIGNRGMRPNQQAQLKAVGKAINDKAVADAGPSKMFIPDWKGSASDKAFSIKAGDVSTDNNTPTVKKQNPANLHGTTSPKMSRVNTTPKEEIPTKTVKPVGKVSGFVSDPSGAPSRTQKIAKPIRRAENLVESGIDVLLGNKVKAHFEIVSPGVLRKMVESYARHGMKLEIVRGQAAWMKDRDLLNTLWESLDAQYNGVDSHYEQGRIKARNRFKTLVQGSFNSLYEGRDNFIKLIDEAFKRVETNARKRYVEGLELMTCMVRVSAESGKADLEIVTEAHTDQMALRQVRNKLMENYGLNVNIEHIFVDGTKYNLGDIEPWTPTRIHEDHANPNGSIVSAYLDAHAAYIDDQSAAAISQVTDEQWPAVLAALDLYSGGATAPGIDCRVAVTRETLDDFDSARDNHWNERGRRAQHRIDGLDCRVYERFQIARGTERRDMTVLDLGVVRLSLY